MSATFAKPGSDEAIQKSLRLDRLENLARSINAAECASYQGSCEEEIEHYCDERQRLIYRLADTAGSSIDDAMRKQAIILRVFVAENKGSDLDTIETALLYLMTSTLVDLVLMPRGPESACYLESWPPQPGRKS